MGTIHGLGGSLVSTVARPRGTFEVRPGRDCRVRFLSPFLPFRGSIRHQSDLAHQGDPGGSKTSPAGPDPPAMSRLEAFHGLQVSLDRRAQAVPSDHPLT